MITFKRSGNFKKLNTFLERSLETFSIGKLNEYGRRGVDALRDATPEASGETANSWSYEIQRSRDRISIVWSNSHRVDGCNIAVILQYGHATRNGSWVEGQDYINPALKPIFEEICRDAWKGVTG